MGKSLVIVESPNKVAKINEYIGSGYVVKASVGHIRDLPPSGATTARTGAKGTRARTQEDKDRKLFARMGLDPLDLEHHWNPQYQILPGKEKDVEELVALAKKADYVYLATDLDREGEAIAWHLQEVIGLPKEKFRRVVFNEITEHAIQNAFKSPRAVNMDMVNAQQTRRFMDRVVGYMVSPLLWEKVGRGLSAGRVQSVALRLIIEKELRIKAFVSEEYWTVDAFLRGERASEGIRMNVAKYLGKEFRPTSEAETLTHIENLNKGTYEVNIRNSTHEFLSAPGPFTTSTMQQTASSRLGFSVQKTMNVAQKLYEAGYITYMRTDSMNLSDEAIEAIRNYISAEFGPKYLPDAPNKFKSKEHSQEAHEAIRPTDIFRTQDDLRGADSDEMRLYRLIRERTLACQMSRAELEKVDLLVRNGDYELKAGGKTMIFDGFTKVSGYSRDVVLPNVAVGDVLTCDELDKKQNFTQPERRYTEGSFVKALESYGIGRPSTWHTIISTIKARGYVSIVKVGRTPYIFAEKIGMIVVARLLKSFTELMDYDFTKGLEERLDSIAEHKLDWITCLDTFYKGFKAQLDIARKPEDEGGMEPNRAVPTDIKCPECGSPMVIKSASTGMFLACSSYSGKKTAGSCRRTINLTQEDEQTEFESDEAENEALRAKKRCPICHSAMDAYILDSTHRLHICANNPECPGYIVETGSFKPKNIEGPTIVCDKCGGTMILKTGRFGNYMGCTNEECKNTRKILASGDVAPPKEDPVDLPELICTDGKSHFVLRDGAAGIFMASNAFPKVRETRAPKVSELKRFRDRLSPKFLYLADAPETDGNGNETVVRFSRKTKQQYIMGVDAEGASTGFIAFYKDGAWVAEEAAPKKKPVAKKTTKATTKKSTTKKEATKKEATKKEATKKEATKKTTTQKTATKKTTAKKTATKKAATKKAATKKAAPKSDDANATSVEAE